MPNIRLIITLMAVVAVLIMAMAAYIIFNYANIDSGRGVILVVIGIIGLFIILGVIIVISKSLFSKK